MLSYMSSSSRHTLVCLHYMTSTQIGNRSREGCACSAVIGGAPYAPLTRTALAATCVLARHRVIQILRASLHLPRNLCTKADA